MIGLPPGTTHTLSAPTAMFLVREMYAAMVSRSSGKPCVGPYFVQPSSSARLPGLDDVRGAWGSRARQSPGE